MNGSRFQCVRRSAMRRQPRLLVVAAGLLICTAIGAGCSRPSAERLNADGNKAFTRGEYPQALDDYRKAQIERPDLPIFNYNAGNVLHQQGDYLRAVTESLRATQAGDIDVRVRAFYSVGADYYRQGKLKEALDAYKNALRLDPSDLDTKYNVEVIQRRLDKEADQRKQLDEQAKQQPTATPAPQDQQQGQQQQPGQGQQSPPPGQQPQSGQQGQPQAGQQGQPSQQPGQQGQQQGGQQGQPDPNAQPGQAGGQGQPQGQAGQTGGSPTAGAAPGAVGTPGPTAREEQAQLNQDLKNAVAAYTKAPSIEEALRILDVIAEQERIAQAEQGTRGDPRVRDK